MQNVTNLNILWIVGASQGFLLTLFLLLKKDSKVNLPLIIFVFLTSVELLFQYIYSTKLIFRYPHLLYISEPFSMLSGPLIFLYTRNILSGIFVFRKTDWLFFIPFILYVLYYFPSYNQPSEYKTYDIIAFYNSGISWNENLYEWITEVLVTLPFLVFSVRLLNKYHIVLKNFFSDISKISYVVVRNLIVACIALYFLETLTIIIAFSNIEIAVSLNSFLYIFVIIFVYIVGYDALVRKTNEVVKYVYIQDNHKLYISNSRNYKENNEKEIRQKYEKNVLSELRIHEISSKIIACIETEKPYRNQELRINELAQLIDEHPNNVSQVLNDVFKKNFYDFINFYRIEDAKVYLKSPDFKNYTISAIGFEVGFNSKTSFYSAFKKFTGTTPSQFQKSNSIEIQ